MPKVSVIITTYNLSYMVGQAMESVLGQTVTDFELIIVNDGSTDNTPLILDSIAARKQLRELASRVLPVLPPEGRVREFKITEDGTGRLIERIETETADE